MAVGTGVPHVLPPAPLRYRVQGNEDETEFEGVGRRSRLDMERALRTVGRALESYRAILDFGCGCGRTLRWLEDLTPSARLHGTDIDRTAIRWCRLHLPFAEFRANRGRPPLSYGPASFDLVYAISVFTHLREDVQLRWLEELRRVAAPGATVLVTLHGTATWHHLSPDDLGIVRREGFLFWRRQTVWKGLFPSWFRTAFHSRRYVEERYSRFFSVLAYLPAGLGGHQDIVVMERP